MLTCLCDSVAGDVGIATVTVLEHLGCEVSFPSEQTCCGQPPFNGGDWVSAKEIAARNVEVFGLADESDPVVTPSTSCAAMLRHGYPMLSMPAVSRAYELCEFIVDVLGRNEWQGEIPSRRIGLHEACHGRMLGTNGQQRRLLESISGAELVPFGSAEQCCGFGGSFCTTHGKVSESIGLEKLGQMQDAGVEQVVSGDMGCLLHLQGLIDRNGIELSMLHIAQVLAEAISE